MNKQPVRGEHDFVLSRLPVRRAQLFWPAVLIGLLVLTMVSVRGARAAAIVVVSPNSAIVPDGLCSLAEAIQNANDDAQTNVDCAAGAGADVITLAVPVAVDGAALFGPPPGPFTEDFGGSGLPEITSDITLTGNAISRTGTADYRFMVVRPTGHLTLTQVTLSNGRVSGSCDLFSAGVKPGCGGALVIYQGVLTLHQTTISGSQALETAATDFPLGGAVFVAGGTVEATNSVFSDNSSEYGGAVASYFSTITVTDSAFTANSAVVSGGAIYNGTLGELSVIGTEFNSNEVTSALFQFSGGGAINNAGSLSLLHAVNSTFDSNSAARGGAILNFNASDAHIINSAMTNNQADEGGAIFNAGSGATINVHSSTIDGNSATFFSGGAGIANGGASGSGIAAVHSTSIMNNTSGGPGGGIATTGQLSVDYSVIQHNNAASNGAGVFVGSLGNQSVAILASTVSNNSAGGDGGGLYFTTNPSSNANSLDVSDSTFDSNTAQEGGGMYGDTVDMTISGSTFSNNTATAIGLGGGGGLYLRSFIVTGAHLAMENSTISGNLAAQDGGGVYLSGSALTAEINNSTIAGNTANSTNGADGLHNLVLPSEVSVRDSILDGNDKRNCLDVSSFGVTDGGHNISSDSTCDFANSGGLGIGDGVDPLIDVLAANGGSTQTRALLAGSPAINNGSGVCPAVDQRGAGRTGACDIGAFEASTSVAALSMSVDNLIIYEAGPTTAEITITLDNSAPGAQPVDVQVPLRVTGSASGVGQDYVLSNQEALGAAEPGRVNTLQFSAAAGAIVDQAFTVTAVDDALVEADETVEITAGLVGNAAFSGGNALSVTIVSDDEPVEPPVMAVLIDIKPGGLPNSINLGAKGTLPVAILSTEFFDAATVDPYTVTLAGAAVNVKKNGRAHAALEDVNSDGLPDLVMHFVIADLVLTNADTSAVLVGQTVGGQLISGVDSINIIP